MKKIKIVAEIGCNHNGKYSIAKEMIKEAKINGADAVKFQTFVPSNLVSCYAQKAEYQKKFTDKNESQLDMIKKLELSNNEYIELKKYADSIGIEIFSTAFDLESIEFLKSLGQSIWKIPSGEITNLPYLKKIVEYECMGKEIILSTGMSNIDEIRYAVNILKDSKNTKFTILHCNTDYPTKDSDVNLRALNELEQLCPNWEIGLSDHSEGIIAAIVAVGMNISFIEKHFTLDKNMDGPDHKASIEPNELRELCISIRRAGEMLGESKKYVTKSERKNRSIARKSIVAKRKIEIGEIFSEDNLICKRPGNGISPIYWDDVIGKKSEHEFEEDELIKCCGIPWEENKNE